MFAKRFGVAILSKRFSGVVLQPCRTFVKVGDKVPVNYLKDEPAPVIKADTEYPDWLVTVGTKGPSKAELFAKYESVGPEQMTRSELKRFKRLIGLDQIREHNAAATAESS